jgi:hypothetical protein
MRDQLLHSRMVAVTDVTEAETRSMYQVFARHYDCVCPERFRSDLREKDCVLVLGDAKGEIRGFSTQKVLRVSVGGNPIRAVFSGDTIVDRAHWGEQELGRCWSRYVSGLYAEEPDVPLYWFLISKGYRTYLYLPLFFETFYPNRQVPTPEFEQRVLDALATTKFPLYYRAERGVIEFPESQGQLKPHLAGIPERRLRNPHVQFFLQRNPAFAAGCELACLAEISPSNMKLFAGRILQQAQPSAVLQPEAP